MIFVSTLSEAERQALEDLTQRAVGRVAARAWVVLWSGEQVPVPQIAARLHCKNKTVRQWLRRYQKDGLSGLQDLPRSGRPTKRSPGLEQAVFMQIKQAPWTFGYLFALWTVRTLCQHLVARCRQQVSPWLTRQILRGLRYRFRRPKVSPRGVDPNREAIHQQSGQKIAQAAAGTVVLVADETDIRLFLNGSLGVTPQAQIHRSGGHSYGYALWRNYEIAVERSRFQPQSDPRQRYQNRQRSRHSDERQGA